MKDKEKILSLHIEEIMSQMSPIEIEANFQGAMRRIIKDHTHKLSPTERKEYQNLLFSDKLYAMEYLESLGLTPVENIAKEMKSDVTSGGYNYALFEDVFLRAFDKSSLVLPVELSSELVGKILLAIKVFDYFGVEEK